MVSRTQISTLGLLLSLGVLHIQKSLTRQSLKGIRLHAADLFSHVCNGGTIQILCAFISVPSLFTLKLIYFT